MGTIGDLIPGRGILKHALGLFDLDERVRGRMRLAIQLSALVISLMLFHILTTSVSPHHSPSNIVNYLRGTDDFTFYTSPGGFYERLGLYLDGDADGINICKHRIDGGSNEIASTVVEKTAGLAVVQSDILYRAGYNDRQIRVVEPIYEEKIHVFFCRTRWQEINGPLPFQIVGCDTVFEWPLLRIEPDTAVARFFDGARVRLKSSSAGLDLSLASNVLDICGLLPSIEKRSESFATALESLVSGELDVVFWTGGAPHLRPKTALENNTLIGMMGIHPEIRVPLAEIYDRPMKPSSFAATGVDAPVYGPRFHDVMTLSTEALLVANPSVPFWVIREASESLKRYEVENEHSPLDGRDFDTRIAQNYARKNMVLGETLLYLALFIYTIGSGISALLLWLVSNRKQSAYLRDITDIYAESLPMHTILERQASAFEVPEIEWSPKRYVNKTAHGIADLVKLIAEIRDDSVTGGITVGHQQYIMSTAYEVKHILRSQLARGLARSYAEGYEFSLKDLEHYYYSGYIMREDFHDLRRLLEVNPPETIETEEAEPGVDQI